MVVASRRVCPCRSPEALLSQPLIAYLHPRLIAGSWDQAGRKMRGRCGEGRITLVARSFGISMVEEDIHRSHLSQLAVEYRKSEGA